MGIRSPTLIDIMMYYDRLINNKHFRQMSVVTEDAYEIEMNKSVVMYALSLHIWFFVYQ